ncbi:glycosyltransferase [Salinarimonas soli]|uniref:Glycosyltransferase n=1 Tax=Salinarimonas soli TaxID=1638099 RepID=A0A5B2VAL2_9HYPH|nr:glycosyltransferase [Salinarimonas soli]KAA2235237.1 glycosyltransferase [Salinarimonas soli]
MASSAHSSGKRLQHRCLRAVLRFVDNAAGGASPSLRGSARYLVGLIDQGRYGEVEALLTQGTRKAARRALPFLATRKRRRSATLAIDAPTQRLGPNATLVPKSAWRYPSPDAPLLASVVIPCYNYGRFVAEAVRSAQAQTISSFEIVVVDDGSTDAATVEVLDGLAREGGITLIRQTNQGLSSARNSGIAVARGEYVCCLDADDLIDPTYLEAAIAVMMADASIGFAYSHVRFFGDVDEVWQTHDFDIQEALVANFTPVSAVFRRDDWREAGGYSTAMRGGFEDWEFWIRLARLGRRGRAIAHALFLHRRHGRTMTHDAKDMHDELHGRIRALNAPAFDDPALRRTLRGLGGPQRDPDAMFRTLTPAVAADRRPGLLVVTAWLRRGGAEALLLSILRTLAPAWRIVIVTTEADPHLMTDAFRAASTEIFHLDGFLDEAWRRPFLNHLVASRAVTHILSSGSAWFLNSLADVKARASHRVAAINVIHNEVPDSVFRAAMNAGATLDHHVAISRQVERLLTGAGVPPSSVTYIPNGIDAAPFAAATERRAGLRAEFGFGPQEIVLIWAGRLGIEKRPDAFVQIVAALQRRLRLRAVIAGDGPLADDVRALAVREGALDAITFAGHVTPARIAALLTAADMLVLTSAVEGLPLIVLEALAAGCPVAATDVGDIALVVKDGIDGVLVPAARPLDLADRIAGAVKTGLATPESRYAIGARFNAGPNTLDAMSGAYARLLAALA